MEKAFETVSKLYSQSITDLNARDNFNQLYWICNAIQTDPSSYDKKKEFYLSLFKTQIDQIKKSTYQEVENVKAKQIELHCKVQIESDYNSWDESKLIKRNSCPLLSEKYPITGCRYPAGGNNCSLKIEKCPFISKNYPIVNDKSSSRRMMSPITSVMLNNGNTDLIGSDMNNILDQIYSKNSQCNMDIFRNVLHQEVNNTHKQDFAETFSDKNLTQIVNIMVQLLKCLKKYNFILPLIKNVIKECVGPSYEGIVDTLISIIDEKNSNVENVKDDSESESSYDRELDNSKFAGSYEREIKLCKSPSFIIKLVKEEDSILYPSEFYERVEPINSLLKDKNIPYRAIYIKTNNDEDCHDTINSAIESIIYYLGSLQNVNDYKDCPLLFENLISTEKKSNTEKKINIDEGIKTNSKSTAVDLLSTIINLGLVSSDKETNLNTLLNNIKEIACTSPDLHGHSSTLNEFLDRFHDLSLSLTPDQDTIVEENNIPKEYENLPKEYENLPVEDKIPELNSSNVEVENESKNLQENDQKPPININMDDILSLIRSGNFSKKEDTQKASDLVQSIFSKIIKKKCNDPENSIQSSTQNSTPNSPESKKSSDDEFENINGGDLRLD